MSKASKQAVEKASTAVRDIEVEILGAKTAEPAAWDEVETLRRLRKDVEVNPIDASQLIQLETNLDRATDAGIAAQKRSRTLDTLRDVLMRTLEKAQNDHRRAVRDETAPEAQAMLEKDLETFTAFCVQHRATLDKLGAAGLQRTGVGFTSKFADILTRHQIRPDLSNTYE